MSKSGRCVFLDRDGVLNENIGYAYKLADAKLLPGVGEALAKLKQAGFLLIVISNQSGVARGMFGEDAVLAFNQELQRQLTEKFKIKIDRFYYCPHLPDGTVNKYAVNCECRKPGTKLIEDAVKEFGLDKAECFFIGDSDIDVDCAQASDVFGIQVATPQKKKPHPRAGYQAKSMSEAAAFIMNRP